MNGNHISNPCLHGAFCKSGDLRMNSLHAMLLHTKFSGFLSTRGFVHHYIYYLGPIFWRKIWIYTVNFSQSGSSHRCQLHCKLWLRYRK